MQMKLLVTMLIIFCALAQNCPSICDTCSGTTSSCLTCPNRFFLTTPTCASYSALEEVLQVVDPSYISSSTSPYVSTIAYNGLNRTTASAVGWTAGNLKLHRSGQGADYIQLTLNNLPPHRTLQIRYSMYHDLTTGDQSQVRMEFQKSSSFFSGNFTVSSFIISLQTSHTFTSDIVRISNPSNLNSNCPFFNIVDITIIAIRCNTNCLTCSLTNSFVCISCGVITSSSTPSIYYFDEISQNCVSTCSTSYFEGSVNGSIAYLCDKCDVACLRCTVPNDSFGCITCNTAMGYITNPNNFVHCILTCGAAQYASGSVCAPCNSNCATCSAPGNFCLSCAPTSTNNYYLDSSNLCVTNCSVSYYISTTTLPTQYLCDVCDTSCLECSVPQSNSSCTSCKNSLGYYLSSSSTPLCVQCAANQIAIGTPLQCTNCDATCKICSGQVTTCFSCQLLFLYNFTCLVTCPVKYYPDNTTWTCQACQAGCLSCTAPVLFACTACTNVTIGSNVLPFYLTFGTTICNTTCLNGQTIDPLVPNTCTPCLPGCVTCLNSTHCSSCIGSTFYNLGLCYTTCPDYYYGDLNTRKCYACSTGCLGCVGFANSQCTLCGNVTSSTGVITSYKKAANSTFCLTACPDNHFATTPNLCQPCSTSCLVCTSSTVCTQCGACANCSTITNSFLNPDHQCVTTCPAFYFGNTSTLICNPCHVGCLTCTGNLSIECTSCGNFSGVLYYKPLGTLSCSTSCPNGEFGDVSTNTCQACSSQCVTCSGTASTCTGNACQTGFFYYSSACLAACPNTTYTFSNQCLSECPAGYSGSVTGSSSTCIICSSSTGCTFNGFTVATTVANGGNNYEHRVDLPQGLSSQVSSATLISSCTVDLLTGARRLLLSTVSLGVQSVTISPDRSFLTILTSYYPANVWTSSISINFQAGTLMTSSGVSYNQLTGTVSLNNPSFVSSYYAVFGTNDSLQAEGIIFVLLAFLLLVASLFLRDRKLTAECSGLIAMVQVLGLARVRDLPLEFDYFDVLRGFSHFELRFVPNHFAVPFFSNSYSEVAIDSAVFVFGTQNFVIDFGSIFYFFLAFQLVLLGWVGYLHWRREGPLELSLFKELQDSLIYLWGNILIYGSLLCLLSLLNNDISSGNLQYAFTILVSFLVVVGYGCYFAFWVREHISTDLFKLTNLFRVFSLLLLAHGNKGALLFFNFSEMIFFSVDLLLYRKQKIDLRLYILERLCFWVVFNAALFKTNYLPLLIVVGVCFGVIIILKVIYLARVCVNKYDEKELQKINPDGMAVSDIGDKNIISYNDSVNESKKERNKLFPVKVDSFNTLEASAEEAVNPNHEVPPLVVDKQSEHINKWSRKVPKTRKHRLGPVREVSNYQLKPEPLEEVYLEKQKAGQEGIFEIPINDSEYNQKRNSRPQPQLPLEPELYWQEESV